MNDALNSASLPFVEELYSTYLENPSAVPPDWRAYFGSLGKGQPRSASRIAPSFQPRSLFNPAGGARNGAVVADTGAETAVLQQRVDQLIRAYRTRGHIVAAIDPLGQPRPAPLELDWRNYSFREEDLDRPFATDSIVGANVRTLREILAIMHNTYCQSIGAQFMHIDDLAMRQWLQERMESSENRLPLDRETQLRILMRLTDAVIFEQFVQKKFIGAKSFSLEGAESLIPLLDLTFEKAGTLGVNEIIVGMAHRGRLNVLANILGKSPLQIFREFEDRNAELHLGRGDVKYHLGHSSDWVTSKGHKMHLGLAFNPSHLEFVNPVVLGRVRAGQDRNCSQDPMKGMGILIHGDAAFAGEGVVQETFNLSQLEGYNTGGTLHVILNNQIGFTTGPEQGRSSAYASDVARMLHIPIFHLNGEDPEAVAQVVNLALDFRQTFRRDVVIDMYCYRRRGHNETDEPSFTQPLLYQAIEKRKNVREGYLEHLLKLEGVTREEADKLVALRREHLERDLAKARSEDYKPGPAALAGLWAAYAGGPDSSIPDLETGVEKGKLVDLLGKLTRLPENFNLHPKLTRFFDARREMVNGNRPLDWSTAEALALGSLAIEGARIRFSGQDSERGTFTQRHAVLHDAKDGHTYTPLKNLSPDQAAVHIINSPLSEIGVMGFEYGYSLACPDGLVLWEAQFGDFVNVGQVIIDQFIASAEEKWHRLTGLVLLLPHAMEGQGPEHSSARLERFLSLAASDNMQIVYPSTPAQYFHALRRQVLRKWRKPLVVMTPKSLLRNPRCVSSLDECASGRFRRVIADARRSQARTTERIVLCTGKIYHELDQHREAQGREDVAIIRIEQLYPLAEDQLRAALEPYADGTPVVWVQEEPENQGAWRFLCVHFGPRLLDRFPFSCVSRPASASPATGSHSSHDLEQEELLAEAFGAAPKRRRTTAPAAAAT